MATSKNTPKVSLASLLPMAAILLLLLGAAFRYWAYSKPTIGAMPTQTDTTRPSVTMQGAETVTVEPIDDGSGIPADSAVADEVIRDLASLGPTEYGTVTLVLTPRNAEVKFLDIDASYSSGMELPVGIYRIQATASRHRSYAGKIKVTPQGLRKSISLSFAPTLND